MKIDPAESTYLLKNFEGPLDFLLHLIQRTEIDIFDISIKHITDQYLKKSELCKNLDRGAEFVGNAAFLLWMKSKTLLPKHEQETPSEFLEEDPRFEVIHQLVEYCRFKNAAKELTILEQKQSGFFLRGSEALDPKKTLGIEHLSLEDLATLFQQVLAKATVGKGSVKEEIWRVADKIKQLRQLLKDQQKIPFQLLFSAKLCREELIVTFLAVLELMKMGLLSFIKSETSEFPLFINKDESKTA